MFSSVYVCMIVDVLLSLSPCMFLNDLACSCLCLYFREFLSMYECLCFRVIMFLSGGYGLYNILFVNEHAPGNKKIKKIKFRVL